MKIRIALTAIAFIAIFIIIPVLSALSADAHCYGKDSTLIGFVQTYKVKNNESLIEIARQFDLGYNEIVDANPDLDPFVPETDMPVQIPTSWVLPDVSLYDGIVINLSEMRLYYFFRQGRNQSVSTFPIGIGREGFDTPAGIYSIIQKTEKPKWFVPESIRKEKPELPRVVPPGPDNPLGSHALRLSSGTILIHGTNKPWGVGRRVSHGCIRLYPEDIPRLFNAVRNGSRVTIVRQPVKVGLRDNKVYLEAHSDDYTGNTNYLEESIKLLRKKNLLKIINTNKLYKAISEKSGIPVEISD